MEQKPENIISDKIIGAAIKVHRTLGPGLFESTYEECLEYELKQTGLYIERQKSVPLMYEALNIEHAFRLDILVENLVIVELKAVESLNDLHFSQVMTYLRLTKLKLGLLINFNVPTLKEGIRRVVNRL